MSEKTALILTGGDSLRLRPLSENRPKSMLPICGKPLLEHTFSRLVSQDFGRILIAADRFSNQPVELLGDCPQADFLLNAVPCGNCVPVFRAAELSDDDSITVIFGNILTDIDLSDAQKEHLSSGADVTLVLTPVQNPANHILAVADKSGSITELIPEPARENCRSDLAVTGIMIFSRETALRAKDYNDLLADFLPSLISEGRNVRGIVSDGFFLSIETPEDYFSAVRAAEKGLITGFSAPEKQIPSSACVSAGAKISHDSVIGENVTVCRGAEISGAIILDGAYIGERAVVEGGIIGFGARLLAGASVREGAVVGSSAVIGEQAVVQCGVRIHGGVHLDSFACADRDVRHGISSVLKITEDGICGETGSVINPQLAALAGSAAASLGGKIGIACRDNPASKNLALALAAGVTAAGADAWFFGSATEPALCFCTAESELSAGCFVDAGITAKIRFCSGDGLPLTRSEEKIIENGINRREYRTASFARFGEISDCSAILRLYENMLEKSAPHKLTGIRAILNTSGNKLSQTCEGLLKKINDKDGKPIVFHIGSDGRGTSAYTDETGYVFEDKLILICCKNLFEHGRDVSLPYNFPIAADTLAESFGRKVLRYSGCPSDKSDGEARKLAEKNSFVRDGAELIFRVLNILENRGISLAEAVAELPETAVTTRFIPTDKHPVKLLGSILAQKQISGDGITINDSGGRVLIRPVKTEKGVLMQVESYSMEAASELCDFYQDTLFRKKTEN